MDTNALVLASIGIDTGKEVSHAVGFGIDGKIAFGRKIKRPALAKTFKSTTTTSSDSVAPAALPN